MDEKDGSDQKCTPVRQQLVNNAVSFLVHPDICSKPDENKISFLKKKDLNDAEISLAFQMAQKHSPSPPPRIESGFMMTPHPLSTNRYSFFKEIKRIGSSIIIVGVALYGLHHFYQLYIEPWIFGKPSRMTAVEMHLQEISSTMTQVKNSVLVLEESLNSQKTQIDNYLLTEVPGSKPIPMVLSELKIEVGKLKSLLTNRHQFPSIPKVASPSIPEWQIATSKSEDNFSESSVLTNLEGSDTSSESIPENLQSINDKGEENIVVNDKSEENIVVNDKGEEENLCNNLE